MLIRKGAGNWIELVEQHQSCPQFLPPPHGPVAHLMMYHATPPMELGRTDLFVLVNASLQHPGASKYL